MIFNGINEVIISLFRDHIDDKKNIFRFYCQIIY